VLVGGTKFGICAVCMGDSDEAVKRALSEEYPSADIERNDEALGRWASQIAKYFAGEEPNLNLPLDIQATAFQWRVWEEIKSIPYGATMSYSKIATALGQPEAARAVARACATNPVPLIVPCHRVIGEDGKLHGGAKSERNNCYGSNGGRTRRDHSARPNRQADDAGYDNPRPHLKLNLR
jgi:AraC family transcriptional regulator of adaptative response/methylated-DNA-[protein]-cysteine methyltransferase